MKLSGWRYINLIFINYVMILNIIVLTQKVNYWNLCALLIGDALLTYKKSNTTRSITMNITIKYIFFEILLSKTTNLKHKKNNEFI